ncbi:MAG: DUF4145 domain-containing protein [Pyrinomonadaceae bacterium]
MNLLNIIEVETRSGYRTFELYQGDITQLDIKVDVIAFSAFTDNYEPVPGTVIGALSENCLIDVEALAGKREFDLVETFGCWVAKATPNTKFERILCAELVGGRLDISEVVENLFIVLSILEMKGIKPQTLALPVLGAGNQKLNAETMIKELLDRSLSFMNHSACMKRILFVEFQEARARQLDRAMNAVLGRVKVVLPKGAMFEGLRKDIIKTIEAARSLAGAKSYGVFNDARRLITSEQVRSFEMGIISRRLVEFIVDDIAPRKKKSDLMGKIEALAQAGIADWITSYMHVLRIFGNESAHEKLKPNRWPPSVTEDDMTLCLFCLQRLLDFWVDFKGEATRAVLP